MERETLEAIRQAVLVEREALEGIWDTSDTRVVWPRLALSLVEEVGRLQAENERLRREGCYPMPPTTPTFIVSSGTGSAR
jgi:hypothetical protein